MEGWLPFGSGALTPRKFQFVAPFRGLPLPTEPVRRVDLEHIKRPPVEDGPVIDRGDVFTGARRRTAVCVEGSEYRERRSRIAAIAAGEPISSAPRHRRSTSGYCLGIRAHCPWNVAR